MTSMKFINNNIFPIALGLFALTMAITGACSVFNAYVGLEDDNIIEEAVEDAIEAKTGFRFDLTP